jgi:hypothetical protein
VRNCPQITPIQAQKTTKEISRVFICINRWIVMVLILPFIVPVSIEIFTKQHSFVSHIRDPSLGEIFFQTGWTPNLTRRIRYLPRLMSGQKISTLIDETTFPLSVGSVGRSI